MLDIKFIRENADVVKKAAQDKLFNVDIDRLLEVDNQLKLLNQKLDEIKEERNKLSSLIPSLSADEKQRSQMVI